METKKKILRLTLKKKWFDMILSGEKKEEYREIKEYWISRLCYDKVLRRTKYFDSVIFKNGYGRNAPSVEVKVHGIIESYGKEEWGAEKGKQYFIILLGKILSSSI